MVQLPERMSQYKASVPENGTVKTDIIRFFENFYKLSDTPDAHDEYRQQFTKDATLIMGPNESKGGDGE